MEAGLGRARLRFFALCVLSFWLLLRLFLGFLLLGWVSETCDVLVRIYEDQRAVIESVEESLAKFRTDIFELAEFQGAHVLEADFDILSSCG